MDEKLSAMEIYSHGKNDPRIRRDYMDELLSSNDAEAIHLARKILA